MPRRRIVALAVVMVWSSWRLHYPREPSIPRATDRESNCQAATATPAEALKVMKDFKAELLYSVPKRRKAPGQYVRRSEGSADRLGPVRPLYRITPPIQSVCQARPQGPAWGGRDTRGKLDLPLGGAHGLLWAFDSLYVMSTRG